MRMTQAKPGNKTLAKLGLFLVIIIDVMGQGLLYPILNTLMMEPSANFLPIDTPVSTRHFNYGLVLGIFYLSWFLGSVYISKLSDSIGRKKGLLICLSGTLLGYLLTIPALLINSFGLLIIGRVITGFTAGNQPIAQAALVDLSRDDAEKSRNLGYALTGMSLGLVIGPIIGGVLSDKALLGSIASLNLPIYAATGLVLFTIGIIVVFFQDVRGSRVPLRIKPQDVFLLIWQVVERPIVMRISVVFFWFEVTLNLFYIFMDNYLSSRFQLSTTGTSTGMLIFGATLAFSSAYLIPIVSGRFSKQSAVVSALTIMAFGVLLFILAPVTIFSYLAIIPIGLAFGVGFPTLLSIYSASVDDSEQGWVMGVSVALFAVGGGATSLIGGYLMGQGIRYPFYASISIAILTLALIATLWQTSKMRQLTQ